MSNPALIGEVGRFLVVGALSTVVNYGVFYVVLSFGVNYVASSAVGFLVGVAVGYTLNKRWTFGVARPSDAKLVVSYWLVYGVSLACGLTLVRVLVEIGGIDPRLANLASIALTTCTNFLGTRFLVFSR